MKKVFVRSFLCLLVFLLTVELSAENRRVRRQAENIWSSRKNCGDNLNVFYNALRNYADIHNGQLPEKNNLAGLKELLTHGVSIGDFLCPSYKGEKYKYDNNRKEDRRKKKAVFKEKHSAYIYFGGINFSSVRTAVPKMIIMCDKFWDTKNKHCNVLTADGKVEQVKQEKNEKRIAGVVDLVDYLNNKYKYPHDIYRALRIRAASIDNALRKSPNR